MRKDSGVILRCRGRMVGFSDRPMVMSIVNVNDDSFSSDGTLDIREALRMARRHVEEGADIIDVGAESARTNRDAISVEEEIARLRAFVGAFQREFGAEAPLLSVNTWRPEVAAAILPLGVDILNDIGALATAENAVHCARHGTALLIMHSVGIPKVAHLGERYADIMQTLEEFFEEKIALAEEAGVARDGLVLDPGIDFAKQRDDNLRIYRELGRLHRFGCPILLPVSRKTVIGEVLGITDPRERDAGTLSCIVGGILRGAHIFRTHNTKAAANAIRTIAPLAAACAAEG